MPNPFNPRDAWDDPRFGPSRRPELDDRTAAELRRSPIDLWSLLNLPWLASTPEFTGGPARQTSLPPTAGWGPGTPTLDDAFYQLRSGDPTGPHIQGEGLDPTMSRDWAWELFQRVIRPHGSERSQQAQESETRMSNPFVGGGESVLNLVDLQNAILDIIGAPGGPPPPTDEWQAVEQAPPVYDERVAQEETNRVVGPEAIYEDLPPGWVVYEDGSVGPGQGLWRTQPKPSPSGGGGMSRVY